MKKTTKQTITLGATVLAATAVTNTIHADEVVTPTVQPQVESTTLAESAKPVETTKETVDEAKVKADEATKAVSEQEQVITTAKEAVKDAESKEQVASEEYAKTKEASEKATPENIAKAEEDVKTKETDVQAKQDVVKSKEADVKTATDAESQSQQALKDAHAKVTSEEAKVKDAKAKVDAAQKAYDASTPEKAQEAVVKAEAKVKDVDATHKAAQSELTRAQKADETRQAKINETKSELDKERTEKNVPVLEQSLATAKANVEAKEKALADAKAKAGIAQSEIDAAQKALDAVNALYQEKLAKFKQDEAARKIVMPADYAKHDIKDYAWFQAHQDEYMKLQPTIDWKAYNQKGIGSNAEILDLANLTASQRKEIAEFAGQMINDLNQQYWSQREPGKVVEPLQLTVGGQEFADAIARGYSKFYADNGGTPDKFNFAKNWGHQHGILRQYLASESLGGLLPQWHKDNMGGYTMLNLKQDIANVIRRMMFVDGDQANGHAKHLISLHGKGIGVSVSSGSVHILSTKQPTNQDKADYVSTDAEYKASLTSSVEKEEKALQMAKDKKALVEQSVQSASTEVATAKNAESDAQTKLNVAQNAIAKAQKAYDDALAVKEQTPEAQAKVNETAKALESAKAEEAMAKEHLANLKEICARCEADLKEAKAQLIAQEEALKTALKEAINAENDVNVKAKATTEAKAQVEIAKQAIASAQQAVQDAKDYLELLKNAPAKLAEADKVLTEAKAKTAEAKATLETEIAKLETLKAQAKDAQDAYTRVFDAYQKLVDAKQYEESLRQEQARVKEEKQTSRTNATEPKTTQVKVVNVAPTTAVGTIAPTSNLPKQETVKSNVSSKVLPSTGESTSALGLMGLVMATLGLVGLKRKRESK